MKNKLEVVCVLILFVAVCWAGPCDTPAAATESDDDYDPEFAAGHFEGNMDIEAEAETETVRNVIVNTARRWPNNEVYYSVAFNITPAQTAVIQDCVYRMQNVSNVRIYQTDESRPGHVRITGNPTGCGSQVGYLNRTTYQTMNLGPVCLKNPMMVCHEFMHTLGFHDQHNAHNRDDYVRIVFENIIPGKEFNFQKREIPTVTDFGLPYDKNSIMHFGPNVSSSNGQRTIEALDGDYTGMGQRVDFSEIDIMKINLAYPPIPITTTPTTPTTTTTPTTPTTHTTPTTTTTPT